MTAQPIGQGATARPAWWGFVPYIVLSIVHVSALTVGNFSVSGPTKLTLMPLLAVAVAWQLWGRGSHVRRGSPPAVVILLMAALLFSWLGDGAGTFFPFAPELPIMLFCFGIAHLCYIWLFWHHAAVRRLSWWALGFAAWWVLLAVVLVPLAGGLVVALMVYGVVLGGTATLATRCNAVVVWGGLLFLASDTILAFRIFAPELLPGWSSPAVMFTYTAGQGLIAAGVLLAMRGKPLLSAPEEAISSGPQLP